MYFILNLDLLKKAVNNQIKIILELIQPISI